MVAGLATFASLARTRSYLFYAILSTPVILLVLDFGKPVDPTLLIDRMIATFIGASIVLVGNQLGASVPASASMSAGRRGPTTR